MDIVVTIPKREYGNDDLETEQMQREGGRQFWAVKRWPAKLAVGERIYFVRGGEVESSMRVVEIRKDAEQTCDTTFRTWRGHLLFMNDLRKEALPLAVKGFQGFRYRWWNLSAESTT